MYLKILSNDDSYDWGGHLRPEKVTVGKVYEILETRTTRNRTAYCIHPDNSVFGTWWIYEEDEHGNNKVHYFIVFEKLIAQVNIIGV